MAGEWILNSGSLVLEVTAQPMHDYFVNVLRILEFI